MPTEWLLDRTKARIREIWPFEAARKLRTVALANAWKGFNGLPKKSMFWKLLSAIALKGHLIP